VRLRQSILVVVVSLLFAGVEFAQSPNGTISGTVFDPAGNVIVGAEITVVNDATRVQNYTKTNNDGLYVLPNLPPGSYRLQVAKFGFKTLIKPDITLNVQDALAINFNLPIGAVSETVTVQGGAPLINTEDAAVSTVIDRNFVESLPLNGRSFNTLLQLTPGVVISPTNEFSPGQFSIAGQRTDANNFTVDGVSANFGVSPATVVGQSGTGGAQAFSAFGGTSSLISVDDLQEFRIETSSFSPEFGRSPGGQVILTTRSGTNDFHGGVFEYFRNTVMDANDWFADQAGEPRAAEHHNDFGGFLGGPIRKNETFFFLSYEGARLDLPQTTPVEVPSAYSRMTASPQLLPYLNAYPQPNDQTPTPGVYISPFIGNYSNPGSLNAGSVRIDHTINDRFSIFGRYNYAPSEILQRSGGLSEVGATSVNTQTLTAGVNMVFSNRLTNTLRGNFSTQTSDLIYSLDSFGGAIPLDPNLLLGSLPTGSYGAFLPGDANSLTMGPFARNKTKQFNFVDDLSLATGQHQLKFGADYRMIFLDLNPARNEAIYIPSSVQSFVSTGQAELLTAIAASSELLSQSVSVYAQDTWRVKPRLTITYGVRWELDPAPSARGATTLASWRNVNNPSAIELAPVGTPLWATTYGNFAPRFGMAYRITERGDFVVRAGAGIFYDTGVGSSGTVGVEYPNSASGVTPSVSLPVTNVQPYLPIVSLQPPYPDGIYAFAPSLKLPRSYQWNVSLEKSIGGTQVLSATYVGQAGRDLLRQQALYQPSPNFLGEFLLNSNDARSNYNALQLQYRRRLSAGLQALLNYSWSHSLDNVSNDVVTGLSNTVISAANDYASSDFDVRQSFSGALTYAFPSAVKTGPLALLVKNWSLDSVIVARSGFPFNGIVFSTSPDPGGYATSRPDRVPGQPVWLYGAHCIAIDGPPCAGGKGLNPAAFAIPGTVRQGTEGRNDITGFGLTQVDLSISRNFRLTERLNLQFRADAFNVLNHPNFLNPQGYVEFGSFYLQSQQMLNQGLGGLNPLFQEGGPRSLQLSLRLSF
jgi:Carboxypeptidase regulatory-like domain/TonB dependent receptor/TonB-dependent Receptor Plug Domain